MIARPDPKVLNSLIWVFFIYLGIGYILYFIALNVARPPTVILGWIENITPFVVTLRTASRVAALRNESPFPAQIIILYCAFSMILISGWSIWFSTGAQFRNYLIVAFAAGGYARFRYALIAGIILAALIIFALILFRLDPHVISWRDRVYFSSSLQSVSLFLISSAVVGLLTAFVIPSIEYALKNDTSNK